MRDRVSCSAETDNILSQARERYVADPKQCGKEGTTFATAKLRWRPNPIRVQSIGFGDPVPACIPLEAAGCRFLLLIYL